MKHYWTVIGGLILFFLLSFFLVEHLHLPLLTDPSDRLATASSGAALLGVLLLTGDIFLPVPSSLVMVANGALFGIVLGTVLSLVGNLAASSVGFFLGRRGSVVLDRFVPLTERQKADRLLAKWGAIAIVLTRPLPLLAETTVVMAGTSPMSWTSVILATIAGALPAAFIYAVTGATAATFNHTALSFGLVLLVAGLFWGISRWWEKKVTLNNRKK